MQDNLNILLRYFVFCQLPWLNISFLQYVKRLLLNVILNERKNDHNINYVDAKCLHLIYKEGQNVNPHQLITRLTIRGYSV